MISRVASVNLLAFKSFRDVRYDIYPLTVLTGLNSAGKSNALEGLAVLSRLMMGRRIEDALEGDSLGVQSIRGGVHGCVPHGETEFTLGCTVVLEEGDSEAFYDYEVSISVVPEIRVKRESLRGSIPSVKGRILKDVFIFDAHASELPGDVGIQGAVETGKTGPNPPQSFRDSHLVISQIPSRLKGANQTERAILKAVDAVISALRSVFVLDPVPSVMRDFVHERNVTLLPNASNLSALLNVVIGNPELKASLLKALSEVSALPVGDIQMETTSLDEVMFSLCDDDGDSTPARELSDGLLRFLAIAVALRVGPSGLQLSDPTEVFPVELLGYEEVVGCPIIVIEEVENGLHPSQAQLLFKLLQDSVQQGESRVMVTTHSPALLDIFTGAINEQIVVAYRDRWLGSRLLPLMEMPGYERAMLKGKIGKVITEGLLVEPAKGMERTGFHLDDFLGGV